MRAAALLLALIALAACDSEPAAPADAAGPDAPPLNCDRQVEADGRFDVRLGACYDARCFDDPESAPPCPTSCEALDEATCLATAGCRVTYDLHDRDSAPSFMRCRAVGPGPVAGGDCSDEGGDGCAGRDDCASTYGYWDPSPTSQTYATCLPEAVWTDVDACADLTCDAGTHCAVQCRACIGDDPTCGWGCSAVCRPDAACTLPCDPGMHCERSCTGDPPTCTESCVPDPSSCTRWTTEAECKAADCYPVHAVTGCTCNAVDVCHCETREELVSCVW